MKELWPGWETVDEIGAGATGKVYKIRKKGDKKEGEYYSALKVISVPSSIDEYFTYLQEGYDEKTIEGIFNSHVENIIDEFRLMAQFKGHSNVVSYEDHMIIPHENGIGYDVLIRMELLTSLSSHCMTSEFTMADSLKLGIDMCRALELCQTEKIIHRDIKPKNMFISRHGDYKLGDFGIARLLEHTTRGTKTGTYTYIAPEVYHGNPYGHTIDLYSLGLVLYWLLNEKRMPFLPLPPEKPTAIQISESVTRRLDGEKLPPPKNGSDNLKNIVLKACAYNASDRYTSASELRRELEKEYAVVCANMSENPKLFEVSATTDVISGSQRNLARKRNKKIFGLIGTVAGIAVIALIIVLLLRGCSSDSLIEESTSGDLVDVNLDDSLTDATSEIPEITESDSVKTATVKPTSTLTATPAKKTSPTPSPTPVSTLKLPTSIEVGDSIKLGEYEQDTSTLNGTEAISWKVLAKEDNRILVISARAIECLSYNETFINLTWEESTIRTWLNSTFIDTAFTEAEKSRILTVTVKNEDNQMYGTDGGNDTQDKVFLLSVSEALKYYSADKDRRCFATTYTNTHGAWKFPEGTCWWFLRSPGNLQHTAATIYNDGSVNYSGQCVSDRTYGIRPAMWIELD